MGVFVGWSNFGSGMLMNC